MFPKIELHVHLEGTVRAQTLLQIARRNGVSLPADSVEGLACLYEFRDFAHFIEVWELTTCALRTADDFRNVVVGYAAEAASHGAIYLEGIFTPAEPVSHGARWEEVFEGYCDGAQQARELHGVQVGLTPRLPAAIHLRLRLTPRATRWPIATAALSAWASVAARNSTRPSRTRRARAGPRRRSRRGTARRELGDPEAVRTALDLLSSRRIRHGIGAARDRGLVREIAARGVVLDVCPVSNLRTRAVPSLAAHPLPELVAAGVSCSISTDDPAMFGTDLTADYAVAAQLAVDPQASYLAGLRGALCDEPTRDMLRRVGDGFDWSAVAAVPGGKLGNHPAAAGQRQPG